MKYCYCDDCDNCKSLKEVDDFWFKCEKTDDIYFNDGLLKCSSFVRGKNGWDKKTIKKVEKLKIKTDYIKMTLFD